MSWASTLFGGATLKVFGVGVAVGLLLGATAGYKARDVTADLAAEKARAEKAETQAAIERDRAAAAKLAVDHLQRALDARDKAAVADAARAAEQAETIKRYEEHTRELEARVVERDCLSESDVQWLRDHWNNPERRQ